TASDGLLSPERVVAAAISRRVAVLALTDHDTLAGLPAARGAVGGPLRLVPGVELSCSPLDRPELEGTIHIVGLLVDDASPHLVAELEAQSEDRHRRVEAIVARLRDLGYAISIDDVMR